jgi:hypothetical protein
MRAGSKLAEELKEQSPLDEVEERLRWRDREELVEGERFVKGWRSVERGESVGRAVRVERREAGLIWEESDEVRDFEAGVEVTNGLIPIKTTSFEFSSCSRPLSSKEVSCWKGMGEGNGGMTTDFGESRDDRSGDERGV